MAATKKNGKTKRATDDDHYVGARIRALRLARAISQTTLGEHLGLTFQQVQKYEKGVNRVASGRLVAIAELFKVTVADLLPPSGVNAGESLADPLVIMGQTRLGVRLAIAFNAISVKRLRETLVEHAEALA